MNNATQIHGPTVDRMTASSIVNDFIRLRGYRSLLALGRSGADLLTGINVERYVMINPAIPNEATFPGCSHDYFSLEGADVTHDIIFVDTVHLSEYAERDIRDSLAHLNKGGVVVVHDCLPTEPHWGDRDIKPPPWRGDTWRAVAVCFSESPFLCYTLDADTGCAVIDTRFYARAEERRRVSRSELGWADYKERRDVLLNVVSPSSFIDLIGGVSA